MIISSRMFADGEKIPDRYAGVKGVNPPLEILDVPPEAVSLVLIVEDTDAQSVTFSHWLVWNINPSTTVIEENSIPAGATAGINDTRRPGYFGPDPASGTQSYFFRLYALDARLDLFQDANRADLENAIYDHVLQSAELMGTYSKA